MAYNITPKQREQTEKKIKRQKEYLQNITFEVDGKTISLLDNTYNANINPKRYFSEVNNRVNTLFKVSQEQGRKAVFLTITAPSELHYTGKKGLYCPYSKDKLYDYGEGLVSINPHDTSLYLSKLWARFLRLGVFKRMKKNTGMKMDYIRVYEPHKSGVPHIHVMIFIPMNYVLEVKKAYYNHFTKYGTNRNALDYKYTWSNDKGGAVAYIIKYINKTFKHADSDELSDEAIYYALHKIRRFNTSFSLVPLGIYRKIIHDDKLKDMKFATKLYKEGSLFSVFDKTSIYRMGLDDEGEVQSIPIYRKDPNIKVIMREKPRYGKIPKKFIRPQKKKTNFELHVNNQNLGEHTIINDNIIKVIKKPHEMKDRELYDYFHKLDIDKVNMQHYGYTKNMMINRGLLKGELISVDAYKIDEFLR